MMGQNNSEIEVKDISGIPAAVEYVEKALRPKAGTRSKAAQHAPVCVITEELLRYLLMTDHTDIRVRVPGIRPFYVQVTARGGSGPDPGFAGTATAGAGSAGADHNAVNDDEWIEGQINRSLLDGYQDHIIYSCKKGVHRYRIFVQTKEKEDLQNEIFSFYKDADPALQEKPLSVLWYIAGHHKLFLILALINRLIKHGAALMLPVLASGVIDDITGGMPFLSRPVLIRVAVSAAMIVINLFCTWLESRQYRRFVRNIEAGFKMAIMQKLHMLSIRYHIETPTGKLLTKLVSDVQYVGMLLFDRLGEFVFLLEDIPYVIIVSLIRFPVMALFFMAVVPVEVFMIHRRMKPIWESKAQMRKVTEMSNAAFKEVLENERTIRAHGLEKTQDRMLSSGVRSVRQASYLFDDLQIRLNNVVYGGAQGFRLLCLCVTGFLASKGIVSIGEMVLFLSLFDTIINSVQRVMDQMPQTTQGYDSLISINEVLFEQDVEHSGTRQLPVPFRGEIELKNVAFGYAPDTPPMISGISFRVPAGKSAALTGGSGSGKTTILNLILGLYTCSSGQVLIDGIDVDELDKAAFRRHVAVVPQQCVLFSGTLLDNLVFGLPYVSTEQIMDALDRVGMRSFVSRHPDGLQMHIQEEGENLSGGQRQRIAIARALLREPKIILLDEPTSALDRESEMQVQEAIEGLMGTCTILIVAHRLNTLRKVDYIYRIEKNRAVLYDSFEQVLAAEQERKGTLG